ncbi:phosphotransferase [Streptosporangiaceae bacterium NEAU-GS5]|nr:phosphotransferase [Streptosporangiaceae bacterium NEAU-GS5]
MSTTLITEDAIHGADLTALVRDHLGDPEADITELAVEVIPHATGSLATRGLHRVSGSTTTGARWSFVAKSISSIRHSPGLSIIPEGFREIAVATFPWRADLDAYLRPAVLPAGFRLPVVHRVDDLGDDRILMWLEDIEQVSGAWDPARFDEAAGLLGRLAALNPAPEGSVSESLHLYADGPVINGMLPMLRDPAVWTHPLVAAAVDPALRDDLLALGERVPALLDAMDRLPHTFGHGDACPQNLLVPADGSARFVAIDWSWPGPLPIGHDLCQLLVGEAHAGRMEPDQLPALHEAILAAYAAQADADPRAVRFGYEGSLALRCAWIALPLERLGDEATPELHDLFRKRAGLARFITDLGLGLTENCGPWT